MQRRARVGRRVKELRTEADLPVLGLAFKAGVNPRTIERIEAGQVEPRRGTLFLIAAALAVPPEEFGIHAPDTQDAA